MTDTQEVMQKALLTGSLEGLSSRSVNLWSVVVCASDHIAPLVD